MEEHFQMKTFEPTISIMIPTYNRADRLEKALLSLDKLDYPTEKIEVLVVNDGSKDNTEEVVKKLLGKMKYNLRYFYQQNKRLSAARNLAIKNSKNEVIVSIDDDMLFPKTWLKTLIKPLSDPKIGAVGGPSIAPSFASLFQRTVDYCMTSSFLGTGGMIGTTKYSLVKYYPRGGNMAIPKKVLDKVGLFDEKFIPAEEIDLDKRIEKAGYGLALAKNAIVWHMPRASAKGFVKQIYSRGYMKSQFTKRHKDFELLYVLPMLGMLGLVAILALFLIQLFVRGEIVFSLEVSKFLPILNLVALLALIDYAALLIMDSFLAYKKIKSLRVFYLLPALMLTQHIVYGLGTFIGIFRSKY